MAINDGQILSMEKHKPRANTLLSIWYGILIGILQAYVIFKSVKRFVWFAELSWPYQKTPFIELNIYIALVGVAVLMLPFFLAASFLRIGNTANDNGLLGRHLNYRDDWAEFLLPRMLYQGTSGFFRTVWTHSGPTASLIHVISSFCLLLPQTIMEAVLIKYQHLSKDTLWTSDMDFMLSQKDRNSILKILSLGEVEKELTGEHSTLMDHNPDVIRVEFFNYALALIVFSFRYSNVFWFTNKIFAILFSVQLMMSSFHTLISFSAFSVLYKLHVFGPEKILHKNLPFLLNHHITLLLYIISIIILLASSGVFYHYGYVKVSSFVKHRAKTQLVTNDSSSSGVAWTYFPHCSALAVLLALAASQSSLVHDATLLYRLCLDMSLLVYVVSVVVFMLLWILTWLGLTIKSKWNFQINVNVGTLRIRDLDALRLTAEIALSGPTDHNKPTTPLASSMLVINEGQAFEVSDIDSKRSILENLLKNSHLRREGESVERIYWPRSCPVSGTQNSLEPEEQPWLKETTEVTPCKNKVTFQDDLLTTRRYSTTPVPRTSALKGSYREMSYTQRKPTNIDEGDYAFLRGGRNPLNRSTTFQESNPDENQALIDFVSASPRHQQPAVAAIAQTNLPFTNVPNTSNMQGTPRSTDSGYGNGTGSSSASCSDTRSTASSTSPPDRTVTGEYPNPVVSTNCPLQECGCEVQQCYNNRSSIYGKIGLTRKDSIRSQPQVDPIYETKRSAMNYGSAAQVPPESIYGDLKNRSLKSPKHFLQSGNESQSFQQVNTCSDDYGIITQNSINSSANEVQHKANGGNNGEYGMTIHRKSSIRRSLTQNDTTIQTTPYGRCTNIKINPFNDQCGSVPIPPPLPPLSFLSSSPSTSLNSSNPMCNKVNNTNNRYSRDLTNSTNFVSPSNFSSHHTIPNHSNFSTPPAKSSPNTFSTFHSTSINNSSLN